MGYGSYRASDWAKLRSSAKISASSSTQELFRSTGMDPKFDPKYIGVREARDSEEHPFSTPIIIGLDVTGSMGYLATQIAKESLHETMMKLFSVKPVTSPQIMFSAIGDVIDRAPLQVTQFESDIRIAEQLLKLWLELGGGDSPEDYELLWYFAAKHTSTDSWEKRGRKGYLFTIGDADCHDSVSTANIRKIFADTEAEIGGTGSCGAMLPCAMLADKAGEKYNVFHIHITTHTSGIPEKLGYMLPGHVMRIDRQSIDALPELIISAMLLTEGRSREETLGLWPVQVRPVVSKALRDLMISGGNEVNL